MTHVDKARAWDAIAEKNAEIGRLKKENGELRKALGPFACLGMNELTPGDRNRARRALGLNKVRSDDEQTAGQEP